MRLLQRKTALWLLLRLVQMLPCSGGHSTAEASMNPQLYRLNNLGKEEKGTPGHQRRKRLLGAGMGRSSEYRVTEKTHIHKQTDTHALLTPCALGARPKGRQKTSSACQSIRSKSSSPREPARKPTLMPESIEGRYTGMGHWSFLPVRV